MNITLDTDTGDCIINGERFKLVKPEEPKQTRRQDIADVMETMLGAVEWDDNVKKIQGWYYGRLVKAAWCATCVSYCAAQCDVLGKLGGKHESCSKWIKDLIALNLVDATPRYGGGAYKAKRGDLLFIGGTLASPDHIGAIAAIDHDTGVIKLVSGNSADSIRYSWHNYKKDNNVLAFVRVPY